MDVQYSSLLWGGLRGPTSPSQGAQVGHTLLQEPCGACSICRYKRVSHQVVVTAAFVKSWSWCVESERCFFIFFLCLRDSSLPLLLPTGPLHLCGSCLLEEGICPQSFVGCCFLLTQKKSRFSGQKCEDMTIIGVVGNTKPKKLSTMYCKDDCDSKSDEEM